jgi:glutathionyl-hydroquinone reductase
LHDESGPVATQGGPYSRETVAFQDKISKQKPAEIFAPEKP